MVPRETFVLASQPELARAGAERLFAVLAASLARDLPPEADIRHVGATSIPGCLTKGDLDIVVRVSAGDFAAAEANLAGRFSRNAGSIRTGEFSSFEAPDHDPPVGIQLTATGCALDMFHQFADALRADPDRLRQYNDLKRAFHGRPMDAYRAAKAAFVDETLRSDSPEASDRNQS